MAPSKTQNPDGPVTKTDLDKALAATKNDFERMCCNFPE
jgi:hypothetical protein